MLSVSFSGGFISGLPQMFFDEALLWQPSEPMQRRATYSDNNTPPSWSWIGWEGEIMIPQWQNHWSHLKLVRLPTPSNSRDLGKPIFQVVPMVKWFYGDSLEERFPVIPSGRAYVDHLNNPSLPLPPKWSQSHRTFGAEKPDLNTVYYYNDNRSTRSRYPVPMLRKHTRPISARYIFCRTTRGYLKCQRSGGFSRLGAIQEKLGVNVVLEDKDYNRIGFLILNGGTEGVIQPPTGIGFELVAISAGSFLSHHFEHPQRTGSDPLLGSGWGEFESFVTEDKNTAVEFYYVMWIGWKNGIAHRKGLGRVLKKAWDREKTDEIDLILG